MHAYKQTGYMTFTGRSISKAVPPVINYPPKQLTRISSPIEVQTM